VSRARLPGDSAQGIVRIGNYERASFLRRTPANATRPDPNKSSVPGSGTRIVSDEFLGMKIPGINRVLLGTPVTEKLHSR
jgi:hypothetical protein